MDKTDSKQDLIENKIRIPNISLGFYQTIGFYPNTRTDMGLGYSVQYVQLFGKTDLQNNILGNKGKGVKAAMNLAINITSLPNSD